MNAFIPRDKDFMIEWLAVAEGSKRDTVEAIRIDAEVTRLAEDAHSVHKNRDGSFAFSAHAVEVGLLDRTGESVRRIVDIARETGKVKPALPADRYRFSLENRFAMPVLSLCGVFRPDSGLTALDLTRSMIMADVFRPEDTTLHDDERYRTMQEFAYAFFRYDLGRSSTVHPKRTHVRASPYRTVEAMNNVYNLGIGQLAREAGLPQLLHAYPVDIWVGDQAIESTTAVTPDALGHAGFGNRDYTAASNPARTLRGWINSVSLTYFMDTGESIMSYDDAKILSDCINAERAKGKLAQQEAA